MKKYRLLFDTPWNKKGEVFLLDAPGTNKVYADELRTHSYLATVFSSWFEEVKPERWRAENGQIYYYITAEGEDTYQEWLGSADDKWRWLNGNVFFTEAQAKEAARRVKATLQAYQEELLNEEV